MTEDIVTKLRSRIIVDGMQLAGPDVMHEAAANEIEKLRDELAQAHKEIAELKGLTS